MSEQKLEITTKDLIDIVRAMVQEMKEPSDEEKALKAKEAAEKQRRLEDMIRIAQEETESKLREQAACGHTRPNGTRCLGGQVHKDRVRLICMRCQKELVNRPATPDDIQNGPVELLLENMPRIAQVV